LPSTYSLYPDYFEMGEIYENYSDHFIYWGDNIITPRVKLQIKKYPQISPGILLTNHNSYEFVNSL
jgi:hypothetical protein